MRHGHAVKLNNVLDVTSIAAVHREVLNFLAHGFSPLQKGVKKRGGSKSAAENPTPPTIKARQDGLYIMLIHIHTI